MGLRRAHDRRRCVPPLRREIDGCRQRNDDDGKAPRHRRQSGRPLPHPLPSYRCHGGGGRDTVVVGRRYDRQARRRSVPAPGGYDGFGRRRASAANAANERGRFREVQRIQFRPRRADARRHLRRRRPRHRRRVRAGCEQRGV